MGALRAIASAALTLVGGCGGERLVVQPLTESPARRMLASAEPSIARDPENGNLLLSWVGDEGSGWRLSSRAPPTGASAGRTPSG